MTTADFMRKHGALAEQIRGREALGALLEAMDRGLAGEGNIPMLPSYLSPGISVPADGVCCVLDAGGTNLRTALARFDADGTCRLERLTKQPMPGTGGELSHRELYDAMAAPVRKLGSFGKVGFCFSYNVTMDRTLDGTLDFWCKEVRAPEAVGKYVGASLKAALGGECGDVRVLNDSVAAMLGADDVQVGVILGTGVNVCYSERCDRIPKVPGDLRSETMIISTEIGEFDGFSKSDFERVVIEASDAPGSAHAEKQCSGGYLGDVVCAAWRTAAAEDLLPEKFREASWDLAAISRYLTGEAAPEIPEEAAAREIAQRAVERAAKIAAVLCAGPILRAGTPGDTVRVAVEGSQYWRLTGFREVFHRELKLLLEPEGIAWEIVRAENACLVGAARAAFAKPM